MSKQFGRLQAVTFDWIDTLSFGNEVRDGIAIGFETLKAEQIPFGIVTTSRPSDIVTLLQLNAFNAGYDFHHELVPRDCIIGLGSTALRSRPGGGSYEHELKGKPSGETLTHLYEKWGVDPKFAVHIGDKPDEDGLAADEAGSHYLRAKISEDMDKSVLDLIAEAAALVNK